MLRLLSCFSGLVDKRRRWCSVCLNLASYECTAVSEVCRGCGLMLCEHCTVTLSAVHNGDLQKMLEMVKDQPLGEGVLGLRADYELLKQDGLLMRYVLWSG